MYSLVKSFLALTFLLVLLASYVCIYLEFWKSPCNKPFVQIGQKCYFFSSNKAPSYEYYKITYKNRVFSVPVIMDWLHANFGCETIDAQSRLVTIQSEQEMRLLADYLSKYAHDQTHPMFWSGGHRGRLSDATDNDQSTLNDFYWHDDYLPMNFTNFKNTDTTKQSDVTGFCVYLEFMGNELIMASVSCENKLAFVCELKMD